MGAGQGKIRRVRAVVAAASPQVYYYDKKWEEFVAKSGILEMDTLAYYLGKTPDELTSAEQGKFFTELFADAVVVGAIVLPAPYVAEDFRFHVDAGKNDYDHVGHAYARIVLRDDPDVMGKFEYGGLYFGPDSSPDSEDLFSLLYLMANGVADLLHTGLNRADAKLITP